MTNELRPRSSGVLTLGSGLNYEILITGAPPIIGIVLRAAVSAFVAIDDCTCSGGGEPRPWPPRRGTSARSRELCRPRSTVAIAAGPPVGSQPAAGWSS